MVQALERASARRHERGHVLFVAVVGLLVLALGMVTSYTLSRAVSEKIALQNAADATAYSLATLEARAFNLIAFANRAQVANYVQMMEAQSVLSYATYGEGTLGYFGDLALTVGGVMAENGAPGAGSVLALGQQLRSAFQRARDAVDFLEVWTPKTIAQRAAGNQALFAVSAAVALTTAAQLAEGGGAIANQNDPEARLSALSRLLDGLNVASYAATFDPGSLGPWGTGASWDHAQRAMSEIANASRYASSAEPVSFIVARSPVPLASVFTAIPVLGGEGWQSQMAARMQQFVDAEFVGTTKLLQAQADGRVALEDTGSSRPDHSALARGDALAAKDRSAFFAHVLGQADFASVVSARERGRHCRYREHPLYGVASPSRVPELLHDPPGFACHEEGHVWQSPLPGLQGGIGPYLKFAPPPRQRGRVGDRFNQPDVWILLSKDVPALDVSAYEPVAGQTDLGSGMHALARAQAYYHRPGAWREPPNFFNPYWNARLAPKGEAITNLAKALGLGASAAQLFADNLWMH